ncbi:hypothetical protein [Pseudonocardia alni]|uniref:hypothetical protein n=1 Tax=Pseudonocardia alni TaxID=33907 RepID=UPI00386CF6E3
MTGWVVVRPYSGHAEDLPLCRDPLVPVDPDRCTTDRFRTARAAVTVTLAGVPAYRQERAGAGWVPVGEPAVTRADLAGILDDGGGGMVDAAVVEQAGGVPVTSALRRLVPPVLTGTPDVQLDLTVDPALQHATATALDAEAGGPRWPAAPSCWTPAPGTCWPQPRCRPRCRTPPTRRWRRPGRRPGTRSTTAGRWGSAARTAASVT